MTKEITRDDVLEANIHIHTSLIDMYDDQPHFRVENKEKVSAILTELRNAMTLPVGGRSKLLDMGCGTGFVLGLASNLFDELHGIDITPAMLDKIDTSSGKIHLHRGLAEKTPFAESSFDIVTAYSFMDHLFELRSFLTEVYRVLKPGGVFYSDQNANRSFWDAVGKLAGPLGEYSAIVRREMTVGLRPEDELAKSREIDTEEFRAAEYIKTQENGIDAGEVIELAHSIGFSDCQVKYDWFLGQGKVMHNQSFADAEIVETYLREVAPLSDRLFKYLRFDIRK
jgi:ubiquinone/menaquinone biosynthesis C-methylase UbiE